MEHSHEHWGILFNAVPIPLIITDHNATVLEMNSAARQFLKTTEGNKKFGDIFNCLRSLEKGCGQNLHCRNCVIRRAIGLALAGQTITRQRFQTSRIDDGQTKKFELLITASPFIIEGQNRVIVVIEDITEITHLRKIIPICMHCKKIRDDENFWQAVEEYMNRFHGMEFSHGICPECAKKYYPDVFDEKNPPEEF